MSAGQASVPTGRRRRDRTAFSGSKESSLTRQGTTLSENSGLGMQSMWSFIEQSGILLANSRQMSPRTWGPNRFAWSD